MHEEILTAGQSALLPLLREVKKDFGLAGGTAAALHIGHRSVDFDLFTHKSIVRGSLRQKILRHAKIQKVLVDKPQEYTLVADGVKLTFYHYPFKVVYSKHLEDFIKLPDLLTIAAMKAYTLGHRAKWKDYVDLYFILKSFHSLNEIVAKAKKIFISEFNEKLFRVQLAFFQDIDYSEEVDFMPGFKVADSAIKKWLKYFSVQE